MMSEGKKLWLGACRERWWIFLGGCGRVLEFWISWQGSGYVEWRQFGGGIWREGEVRMVQGGKREMWCRRADSWRAVVLAYRSWQEERLNAYLPYLPYWVLDGQILVASVNQPGLSKRYSDLYELWIPCWTYHIRYFAEMLSQCKGLIAYNSSISDQYSSAWRRALAISYVSWALIESSLWETLQSELAFYQVLSAISLPKVFIFPKMLSVPAAGSWPSFNVVRPRIDRTILAMQPKRIAVDHSTRFSCRTI